MTMASPFSKTSIGRASNATIDMAHLVDQQDSGAFGCEDDIIAIFSQERKQTDISSDQSQENVSSSGSVASKIQSFWAFTPDAALYNSIDSKKMIGEPSGSNSFDPHCFNVDALEPRPIAPHRMQVIDAPACHHHDQEPIQIPTSPRRGDEAIMSSGSDNLIGKSLHSRRSLLCQKRSVSFHSTGGRTLKGQNEIVFDGFRVSNRPSSQGGFGEPTPTSYVTDISESEKYNRDTMFMEPESCSLRPFHLVDAPDNISSIDNRQNHDYNLSTSRMVPSVNGQVDGTMLVPATSQSLVEMKDKKSRHSYQLEQWDASYKELLEYRKTYGHCNVPYLFKGNKPLSQWVKRQRHQRKLKKQNRHSNLTDEREAMLDAVGFCWDARDAAWDERYNDLVRYKRINGHVRVSRHEDASLNVWLKRQRHSCRMFLVGMEHDGSSSNTSGQMTIDRCRRLLELGVDIGYIKGSFREGQILAGLGQPPLKRSLSDDF